MDRITAINKSVSAFVSGIIGCVPILGLGSAIYALICWQNVRRQYQDWNPATHYLNRGALLGLFGVLMSLLAVWIIALAIANG